METQTTPPDQHDNAHLKQRFLLHVRTRVADLLCDTCSPTAHVRHHFSDVDIVRNAFAVDHVRVLFVCDACGTVRMWGRMGSRVDLIEEPDTEPTDSGAEAPA